MGAQKMGVVRGGVWCLPLLAVGLLGVDRCQEPFETYDVPMRDGALLATDVYRAPQVAPTILIRTPYGREGLESLGTAFNSLGYSAVTQDIRGTGGSEGTFMLFSDDGWGETQDGFDSLAFATAGDWSNGEACMYGGSALAITSLAAAGSTPPNLRCVFSLVGTGDLYHHAAYQGGALLESLLVGWLTGLGEFDALDAALASPLETDALWQATQLPDRYESVEVPIYHMGGWYDIFSQGTIDGFVGLDTQGGPGAFGAQKMLIGPWTHGGDSGPELTYPDSTLPGGEETRWFERWLKGAQNGVDTEPAVKFYLMGDPDRGVGVANRWVVAESWPPPSVSTSYYLKPFGALSPSPIGGGEGSLGWRYDPSDPVPTVGGNNLTIVAGPLDQREVLDRPDVLTFRTEPLTQPVVVAGRISARLWVSTTAVDTDFTVKLMDVYPDGRHMLVLDGVTRLRFREGQDQETLATPGQIYEVEVDLWSTAIAFEEGHRIAVALSSSNSPRFDVNPNTGDWSWEGGPTVQANQTLYVDAGHPSRLILPVAQGL